MTVLRSTGKFNRKLLRDLGLSIGMGFVGAEIYWHAYVMPRQNSYRAWYRSMGIDDVAFSQVRT